MQLFMMKNWSLCLIPHVSISLLANFLIDAIDTLHYQVVVLIAFDHFTTVLHECFGHPLFPIYSAACSFDVFHIILWPFRWHFVSPFVCVALAKWRRRTNKLLRRASSRMTCIVIASFEHKFMQEESTKKQFVDLFWAHEKTKIVFVAVTTIITMTIIIDTFLLVG